MHIFINMDTFDLKHFLVKNKLTEISRLNEIKVVPSKTGFKTYYAVVNVHGDYFDGVAKYIITSSKKEMIDKLNASLKDVVDRPEYEPMYKAYELDDERKQSNLTGDSLIDKHYILDNWAWVTDKGDVFQENIKSIEEYLGKKVVRF